MTYDTIVVGAGVGSLYAARELFLGSVPTAFYTGGLAADLIIYSGV
jgi:ribulose 1,5-bisphosphate synthetase/thiazole synthase